ncbi:hypothetical protein GCK32_021586, partial [Trichostrongylus colubriformis]
MSGFVRVTDWDNRRYPKCSRWVSKGYAKSIHFEWSQRVVCPRCLVRLVISVRLFRVASSRHLVRV